MPQKAQIVDITAKNLLSAPKQNYDQIFRNWSNGVKAIWDAKYPDGSPVDPATVLAKLGVHAVELFQLSSATAAFLTSISAIGCTADQAAANAAEINAVVALVKPFTAHQDGTVTVN